MAMVDEALVRALRPVAEAMVTSDDARRARNVDAAIRDGGTVKGDRVRGRIGRAAVGTVDATSVVVGGTDLNAAVAELERKAVVLSLLLGGV